MPESFGSLPTPRPLELALARAPAPARLRAALRRAAADLTRHALAAEAAGGLLDESDRTRPTLVRREGRFLLAVAHLRARAALLARRAAREANDGCPRLHRQALALAGELRRLRHEQAELLFEADAELGVGD